MKNKYIIEGNLTRIELYNSKGIVSGISLIDTEDAVRVQHLRWGRHEAGYVYNMLGARGNRTNTYIHNIILPPTDGIEIDHINGDGLDNRKVNLRLVTHAQNQMNRRKKAEATSIYKGVYWHSGSQIWCAKIGKDSKQTHLGSFVLELDAMKAYNKAALKLFGEYAKLNVKGIGCI